MKVVIKNSLFLDRRNDIDLIALIRHGKSGKHRIIPEKISSLEFLNFIDRLPSHMSDVVKNIISSSAKFDNLEPSSIIVGVKASGQPEWNKRVPLLPINDAISYLSQPFRILVENSRNDRAFLLTMATEQQRKFLEKYESLNFIEFQNGGGVAELLEILREYTTRDEWLVKTTWVLIDSDSLEPGEISPKSKEVCDKCSQDGVKFHALERRSIENYLPHSAIRASTDRKYGKPHQKFIAFKSLSPQQQNHYNMKGGFRADRAIADRNAGLLFHRVPGDVLRELDTGFGKYIGAPFRARIISDKDIDRHGGRDELKPVVDTLISLIR